VRPSRIWPRDLCGLLPTVRARASLVQRERKIQNLSSFFGDSLEFDFSGG